MTVTAVGPHRLIAGDALQVMRRLPGGSFDVIVTSPPYNLQVPYRGFSDDLPPEVYLGWLSDVVSEMKRLLKPDGSLFLNLAGSSKKPWMPFEAATLVLQPLMVLQNYITWVKAVDDRGHFKPVAGKRFIHRTNEHLFHLTHRGDVQLDRLAAGIPYADKTNLARRGHVEDRRCRGNTWFIPYGTIQDKADRSHHPAAYPVELPHRCLRLHGRERPLVLDPFVGSGTTALAVQTYGGTCLGIDASPEYLEAARLRLASAQAA